MKDFYEMLQDCGLPIIIYGMGNGGDKLFEVLDSYQIPVQDVMASDAFVRGQSFHSIRVKKRDEIEKLYPNAIILVAFGSRDPEVLDALLNLSKRYPVYIPDLPVAGSTYFTKSFYKEHLSSFEEAKALLCDPHSKNLFDLILKGKLEGKLEDVLKAQSDPGSTKTFINYREIKSYLDVGAYTGDTIQKVLMEGAPLEHIYAMEPDAHSFKKLQSYIETLNISHKIFECGAWFENTTGYFSSSKNRNSTFLGTASFEYQTKSVSLQTVDSLFQNDRIDFIKYDVEGAEMEALKGSYETIKRNLPILSIPLYHRPEDLYKLPLEVHRLFPEYNNMMIERIPCIPLWEINLICKKDHS